MPSTSTLVDSIYTRRVSAGECYPPDLVKSQFYWPKGGQNYWPLTDSPCIPGESLVEGHAGKVSPGLPFRFFNRRERIRHAGVVCFPLRQCFVLGESRFSGAVVLVEADCRKEAPKDQ